MKGNKMKHDTPRNGDDQDFDEDMEILRILVSKLFRRAINASDQGVAEPADLEKEALDTIDGLEGLDEEWQQMNDISEVLSGWRDELASADAGG